MMSRRFAGRGAWRRHGWRARYAARRVLRTFWTSPRQLNSMVGAYADLFRASLSLAQRGLRQQPEINIYTFGRAQQRSIYTWRLGLIGIATSARERKHAEDHDR